MSKYFIGVNHTKQKRFFRRSKKFILIIIFLLLIAGAVIVVDSYINKRIADAPSSLSESSKTTVTPDIEIFTTNFFQFQTDKYWKYITNDSTPNKYVYRRTNGKIIYSDMTVYVNSIPSDMQATRLLPVDYDETSKMLKAQELTDHCRANIPAAERDRIGEKEITLKDVKFLCDVDGTLVTEIAGKINDTPRMKLPRTDGSTAEYIIYYRDLRAIPLNSEFMDIINT